MNKRWLLIPLSLLLLASTVWFCYYAIRTDAGTGCKWAATSGDSQSLASCVQGEIEVYRGKGEAFRVLYWALALLSTGGAIATGIRTSMAKTNPANDEGETKRVDRWALGLSIATIIGTALLTAVNPQELATRYCYGQIQLEKALFHYKFPDDGKPDLQALTQAYDAAEDTLVGGLPTQPQTATSHPDQAARTDHAPTGATSAAGATAQGSGTHQNDTGSTQTPAGSH